ncbi:MAG TPA: hypothetical protein VGC18_11955 [Lacisediminihabitans sp.]
MEPRVVRIDASSSPTAEAGSRKTSERVGPHPSADPLFPQAPKPGRLILEGADHPVVEAIAVMGPVVLVHVNELVIPQKLEMAIDGGPADAELLHDQTLDITRIGLAAREDLHNPAPDRFGQELEDVHGHDDATWT